MSEFITYDGTPESKPKYDKLVVVKKYEKYHVAKLKEVWWARDEEDVWTDTDSEIDHHDIQDGDQWKYVNDEDMYTMYDGTENTLPKDPEHQWFLIKRMFGGVLFKFSIAHDNKDYWINGTPHQWVKGDLWKVW